MLIATINIRFLPSQWCQNISYSAVIIMPVGLPSHLLIAKSAITSNYLKRPIYWLVETQAVLFHTVC